MNYCERFWEPTEQVINLFMDQAISMRSLMISDSYSVKLNHMLLTRQSQLHSIRDLRCRFKFKTLSLITF